MEFCIFFFFGEGSLFIKFRLCHVAFKSVSRSLSWLTNANCGFDLILSTFVAVSVIVGNLFSKLFSTKRQLWQRPNPQTQMWFLFKTTHLMSLWSLYTHANGGNFNNQELHTFSSKCLTKKKKSFPTHHYAAGVKHHHNWGLKYTYTYKHRLCESRICFTRAQQRPYSHIKLIT